MITHDPQQQWAVIEVYVGDFMGMMQCMVAMVYITRAIMHVIEVVFPEPNVSKNVGGKHPISAKKSK
jgi:hypothetical protein